MKSTGAILFQVFRFSEWIVLDATILVLFSCTIIGQYLVWRVLYATQLTDFSQISHQLSELPKHILLWSILQDKHSTLLHYRASEAATSTLNDLHLKARALMGIEVGLILTTGALLCFFWKRWSSFPNPSTATDGHPHNAATTACTTAESTDERCAANIGSSADIRDYGTSLTEATFPSHLISMTEQQRQQTPQDFNHGTGSSASGASTIPHNPLPQTGMSRNSGRAGVWSTGVNSNPTAAPPSYEDVIRPHGSKLSKTVSSLKNPAVGAASFVSSGASNDISTPDDGNRMPAGDILPTYQEVTEGEAAMRTDRH